MDCYEKMYYTLFNKITGIIEELQAIQAEAEEVFLSQASPKEE